MSEFFSEFLIRLQENAVSIILAVITTGGLGLWIKSYYGKPITLAKADEGHAKADEIRARSEKSKAEAAIILVEGMESVAEILKTQMKVMEERYEARIKALEEHIGRREKWFSDELEKKDKKITDLQDELFDVKRRLSRYEKIKEKTRAEIVVAKEKIHQDVNDALEQVGVKEVPDHPVSEKGK